MLKDNFSKTKSFQRKQKNSSFIKLKKLKILQIEKVQKNKNLDLRGMEK